MDEQEYWQTIKECPSYEISNRGVIRRIVAPRVTYLNEWGYPTVQLWQGDGTYKSRSVHRLVAEAFIPNPQNLPEVNHKDGNKLNFQPENLEWCTRLENQRHMQKLGLRQVARGEKSGMAKLTEENVRAIHALANEGLSQRLIGKQFNIDQGTVSAIVRGISWAHLALPRPEYPGTNLRNFRGEQSSRSKLTEDQVREIRSLQEQGKLSEKEIANRFNVSASTIGYIVRRKTWTHI